MPTVGLAAHLATSGHGGRAIKDPLSYLLAPWGVGHMLLYALASAASYYRQRVRLALLPDWKTALLGGAGAGADVRNKRLRDIFERFDTSGAPWPSAEPGPKPAPAPALIVVVPAPAPAPAPNQVTASSMRLSSASRSNSPRARR